MALDHPAVTVPYFTQSHFAQADLGRPECYSVLPTWCKCGFCCEMVTTDLTNNVENVCCMQADRLGECEREECVTKESYFFDLCMRQSVVDVSVEDYAQTFHQQADYTNRKYRSQAYRKYILFQFGKVGHGVRIPVPACVAARIHWRYPEPDGRYTGFSFSTSQLQQAQPNASTSSSQHNIAHSH